MMLHLLVLCLTVVKVMSLTVEKLYRDQQSLQTFVIDKHSGEVFIGGQNTLVKLSSDLHVLKQVDTGPKMDSPLCPPPSLPCNRTKSLVNSVTKGLLIDYHRNNLIVCSNVYQGSCQLRNPVNIEQVKHDITKPIVGHDPIPSDFLLIAPGPESNALYVGSKYHNINPNGELKVFRDKVPHLASRNLDNFELTSRNVSDGTKISLLDSYKMDFHVNFLYGFSHGSFVYFITLQAKSLDDNTMETKIIRVCQNDKYFRSYVEIPLLCYKDKNKPYVIAKGANFEKSSGKLYVIYEQSDRYMSVSSAFCGYQMANIRMMFDSTVEQCQQGSGSIGPSHLHTREQCAKSNGPVVLCGESDQYPSIEGLNPIDEEALLELPVTRLTSVLATKKGSSEIVYLGTDTGKLIKVVVSSGNQVSIVKDINIDYAQPVIKLEFSADGSKVMALTSNKLLMVNPDHCSERKTCGECSVGQDPVCGWCVLENSCTEEDSCSLHSVVPHWLIQGSCAKMVEIFPKNLSYETIKLHKKLSEIQFKLETIMLSPNQNKNSLDLQCSFVSMKTKAKTIAQINEGVVKCPLPEELPVVQRGKDFHDLQVEFHISGKPIVKRSVPLYDCRVHTSCTNCTSSKFSCMWQYMDDTCVSTATNTASKQSGVINPDECPRVESPSSVSEIVVHSGESKQIAVRAVNFKTEQRNNLHCSFQYQSKVNVVPANITSSTLTCEKVKFEYSESGSPSIIANFKITWGSNSYVLDNPNQISVRIFKCALLVLNCGQCLSLQPEYECGWCGDHCSQQKQCNSSWQDRSAICSNPQILRFSPSVGPAGGKTNVSISGINLGKTATDIQSGVTIAGVRCTVLPEHYQPSFMFKCETEPTAKPSSGPVQVIIGKKYTAVSQNNFTFVEPQVLFLTPTMGPRSGGTMITIGGTDLNAGTSVTVSVGGSSCQVKHVSLNTLSCKTSPQTGPEDSSEIEVSFGGYTRLMQPKFSYMDDPEISEISPKKSILRGGTKVVVKGTRLNIVQRAEFFIEVGNQKFSTICDANNIGIAHWLTCKTPKLNVDPQNVTLTNPKAVHYGFNLDGVKTYRNLSLSKGMMEYYPDPEVDMFDTENQEVKYKAGKPLVIKGNFQGIQQLIIQDLKVFVGKSLCEDKEATDLTVNCTPPAKANGLDSNGNAEVYIKLGNYRKKLGYLSYFEPESADKPIALGIILGVVIPIIAIILLLAFCIIKRQRKNGPTKNAIPDMLKDYDTVKEEEDIGLLSVKADLNGQIPNNDTGPYITELLSRIPDESMKQKISTFLIARSQMDIGEVLAKGFYGNTYKAEYKISADKDPSQVTIKVLQGFHTDTDSIDNFVQHMVTYGDLQHYALVPYLGVCLGAVEDPILVSSYTSCTDLKTYVKDVTKNLTVSDILEMSQQIADTMVYLQSLDLVHGNLAARNCLLTENNKVQLTDYGYTQLFTSEFYSMEDDKRQQIVKWIAPECLDNFQFTTSSDIWSFGIVLWELLTRGVTPYPDVEPKNIKSYLNGGKRLKKPRQCPESLYLLMLQCWTEVANDRPTFHDILSEIKKFISKEESNDITQPLSTKIEPGGSSEYLEVVG